MSTETDVLLDCRETRGLSRLREQTDASRPTARRDLSYRGATQTGTAAGGLYQSSERPHERRFPGTVRAHDSHHLAGTHAQINAANDFRSTETDMKSFSSKRHRSHPERYSK